VPVTTYPSLSDDTGGPTTCVPISPQDALDLGKDLYTTYRVLKWIGTHGGE